MPDNDCTPKKKNYGIKQQSGNDDYDYDYDEDKGRYIFF